MHPIVNTLPVKKTSENFEASPKARSWETLIAELKRLAKGPSTEFWTFWRGMTAEERMTVLKDEPQAGRH